MARLLFYALVSKTRNVGPKNKLPGFCARKGICIIRLLVKLHLKMCEFNLKIGASRHNLHPQRKPFSEVLERFQKNTGGISHDNMAYSICHAIHVRVLIWSILEREMDEFKKMAVLSCTLTNRQNIQMIQVNC